MMIGVSLYFQDINLDYLSNVIDCGVTHVFTSLQVIEEEYGDVSQKIQTVLEFCKDKNIILIPDIAPRTLEKLKIKNIEEIKELGLHAIRIDGGYGTVEEVKKLTNLFEVYLNASDVQPSFIKELNDAGCDMSKISVMHNFYPRLYTGLEKEHMISINKEFKKNNVRVGAFVQGDVKLRGPVFEGLPTLESHRGVNPYVACVELLDCYVDDVYIGDNEASVEAIQMMLDYQKDNVLTLKAVLDKEYEDLYNKDIPIRRDITEHIVRLSYGRGVYNDVLQRKTLKRCIGDITIDNNLSGRYVGEINICKKNLNSDGKVNIVGHVYPELLSLLDMVKRDTIIRFVR
ncbi:MAG: MupG family TIM beta-alpha barrel fold protein [Coprobacillus sp.]